jgi:alkylhydroperoxidase/carboxymuconolactone decarboxylase family protein YurZ
MAELPPSGAGIFAREFPATWEAYEALGKAASEAGPLDVRTRRLVKLALAIGAGSEGAVHSHTRQGLAEGLDPKEIKQIAVMAITTLGFPAAMASFSWMRDILRDE